MRLECSTSNILECGQLLVLLLGLCLAYQQLQQLDEQQRWQNYSELNYRYAKLYREFPIALISGTTTPQDISPENLRAIRQYFDLYSEEYWLYQNNLIPEEMWHQRIRNGALLNLSEYPRMVQGYRYWKEKGAFQHPPNFNHEIEQIIVEICIANPKHPSCQSRPTKTLPP